MRRVVSTAAATSVSLPPSKWMLPWHYRVNTRGDRRRDGHANDRLVCSPYYPPHNEWAAGIRGRRVDNAVGLDGRQQQCALQREVQSKVDVLGGPPATAADAVMQVEHRLNLARQIVKMATRVDRRFLATSDPLENSACALHLSVHRDTVIFQFSKSFQF